MRISREKWEIGFESNIDFDKDELDAIENKVNSINELNNLNAKFYGTNPDEKDYQIEISKYNMLNTNDTGLIEIFKYKNNKYYTVPCDPYPCNMMYVHDTIKDLLYDLEEMMF